jgi:hypothetical protein
MRKTCRTLITGSEAQQQITIAGGNSISVS